MKIQDVKKLAPGDEVYYNDPDDGICSRFYIISKIEIVGGDVNPPVHAWAQAWTGGFTSPPTISILEIM